MATIDTIADRSTGSAIAGKAYFETSTNKFIVFNGTAWIELDSDGTGAVPFENRWGATFDGADDTLSVSDSSLDLKTDFSISCWFNRGSGVVSWDALVSWGEANHGKYRAFGFNANNNLTFNAYGMGFDSSGQTLSNSTWYHGVLTLSGTGSNAVAKVYVNGTLDSTVTGFALLDYSTYAGQLLGASSYGGAERFEGEMDDLAIFNTVLDQTAVTALYNSGVPARVTGATGYWRMGDDSNDSATSGGSISTITDSSGNGNDMVQATASSQPTFKALAQSTTPSVSFDGSNDYLTVTQNSDINITGDLTVSAWVNLDNTSGYNAILTKRQVGGSMNYQFTIDSSGQIGLGHSGGAWVYDTNSLTVGTWHHVAATVSSGTVQFYIDGVAKTSSSGLTITGDTNDLTIGATTGYNYFSGKIDEVAVFNTALTQPNITSLATSQTAHIVNDLSLSPTAYYRMGEDDSLANGASASQISDASGNGNHATQSTAANQPTASIEPIIYV